jgi:Asp-tRNA(Asn)/Glu-tRNA(Gln) amidotransferase A subunit family amidase
MKLHELSLTQMLGAIAQRRCTPLEIVRACLQQIATHESRIGAWARPIDEDGVLQVWQSEAPARGRSLLQGLPVGVKDTIDVAKMPAERGSAIWCGRVAQEDAACVSLLKSVGAFVLGKTVTTEFAYFKPGKTVNPHNDQHTPGGSSSGSAAAVASGMVPVALGSQTAASVIRPASYCGIAAWVATRGAISLRGVMPLAQSCDSLGILARDVHDLLLIEGCLRRTTEPAGAMEPVVLMALDPDGLVDSEMGAAYEEALAKLTAKGVRIERSSLGAYTGDWNTSHARVMAYEAAQNLAFEYQCAKAELSDPLRQLIEGGMELSAETHAQDLAYLADISRVVTGVLQDHAVLIAPAATGAAPLCSAGTGRPDMSRPWQWLGLPQACLPCARSADSLPLGIQLVGRPNQDRELLRQALWLQQHLGWQAGNGAESLTTPPVLIHRPSGVAEKSKGDRNDYL